MNFAVIGLNHGHIYSQVDGLLKIPAARCVGFHAVEPELCTAFTQRYPSIPWREKSDILRDPAIDLITSASIFSQRGPLAGEILRAGKHALIDKPPVTTLAQVESVARALADTGKLLFVCYGERLGNPLDIKAKQLVDAGVLGNLVHVMGLGPHKLTPASRPAWFFDPGQYGGILNDIASHQIEWFVWLTGQRIRSFSSRVGHFGSVAQKDFQDFGDATLIAENGVTGYVRVDWFTPAAMPTFGDIRGLIVGTKGTLEIRRTIHSSAADDGDRGPHMILTTVDRPPHRVDASDCHPTWYHDIAESLRQNRNLLIPHDTLLHVMEMTVRIQQNAAHVTA